jgi:hypothetical protein
MGIIGIASPLVDIFIMGIISEAEAADAKSAKAAKSFIVLKAQVIGPELFTRVCLWLDLVDRRSSSWFDEGYEMSEQTISDEIFEARPARPFQVRVHLRFKNPNCSRRAEIRNQRIAFCSACRCVDRSLCHAANEFIATAIVPTNKKIAARPKRRLQYFSSATATAIHKRSEASNRLCSRIDCGCTSMEAPIHRVISESEDVCNMETEAIEHDSVRGGETDNINEPSPMEGVQTEFASPASHVVEPEISKNEEGAPFTLVHSRSEDAASSSSLSDGSEPDTTKDDEDMKPSPKPPKPAATPDSATPKKMQRMERNNLIRMDSAANDSSSAASHRQSSQNSSRDWGWFEDVHQSTDGLTPSEKKSAQKRKAAQQGTESPQQNPGKKI